MKKFFSLIAAVLFAGSMMATEVTVSKTVEELATANSWANGTVVTPFALDEVITVSTNASDANTGKYYTSGQQIRLYQSGAAELIISAAEGYTISSITLTYVSQNTGIFVEAESGVAVDFENVQSATFTVGNSGEATNGQARVTAISVTYNGEGGVTPPPADTYTVAGSDAAIFGEAWNPALAANDMVLAAGIYKWEKAELNLAAGSTIEFKVVKNHSWDNPAWPAQNYVLNIAEEGEYTITITFDLANEAVAAEAVKKEAPADPTNCAEAAEAALSVSANNELYNNGAVYTIEGYVTGIKTAYSDEYHNISFWMADAADGGEVLQAYRAACASEADAPQVGDKVAVTGSLTKYNTTPEFAAGCTFVIVTDPLPVEHTYTVAGSSDVLFGTAWDPANTANDMALVEGLYTWEKSELTLAAGNILFKVCEDHAWTTAYPAQNYELNIPGAGIYTITITFDPANDNAVNAVATKTGDAVVVPTVAMHGNFLGSWADTENFAIAQDNASASLTLTLAEGNYEFGMRIGGSGNWTANGANLTREANTTNLAEGSGNMHIAADVAGDYVFTYTYETQILEVVYPEAPVVPDTIVLDFSEGGGWVDNQYFEEYGSTDLVLYNIPVVNKALAGDGQYLNLDFYPEDANDITGTYSIADETLDDYYTYMMVVTGTDTTEVLFTAGEVTFNVLAKSEEQMAAQIAIAAELTGDDGNIYTINGTFVLYYDFLPTEEGVENVATDPKAAIKRIEMGQLIIEKNGVRYNANGQIVR